MAGLVDGRGRRERDVAQRAYKEWCEVLFLSGAITFYPCGAILLFVLAEQRGSRSVCTGASRRSSVGEAGADPGCLEGDLYNRNLTKTVVNLVISIAETRGSRAR